MRTKRRRAWIDTKDNENADTCVTAILVAAAAAAAADTLCKMSPQMTVSFTLSR